MNVVKFGIRLQHTNYVFVYKATVGHIWDIDRGVASWQGNFQARWVPQLVQNLRNASIVNIAHFIAHKLILVDC